MSEVWRATDEVPALDLPGLPPRVGQLLAACLSADPAGRPSAEQVAVTLASASGLPDPTAALPPAGAPKRPASAAYAVGSAAPPHPPSHPPTMVDHTPVFHPERPAGRSPLPLVGVLGGMVALVLAVILVAAALQSGGGDGGGAQAGPATGSSPSAPATSAPAASAPLAVPDSRDELIALLGQQIDAALAAGSLDPDAADELRDRLSDLDHGNLRKRAADLDEKIDDLREDDEISQAAADQLHQLLQPLTSKRGHDGGDEQG